MVGRNAGLAAALAFCAAATLVHHAHNAEFLAAYPNLPPTITRANTYAAWLGATLTGLLGYVLVEKGWRRAGLLLIGLQALYAVGGLAHYYLAPPSAHTLATNATIWLEAVAGALLLATVMRRIAG